MRKCDEIISDPEGFEEIQVKAMAIMIRAIDLCYDIIRDVDIEELKHELRKLEEENRRARENQEEAELGYDIEEEENPSG